MFDGVLMPGDGALDLTQFTLHAASGDHAIASGNYPNGPSSGPYTGAFSYIILTIPEYDDGPYTIEYVPTGSTPGEQLFGLNGVQIPAFTVPFIDLRG
jgi:hypothetical protein